MTALDYPKNGVHNLEVMMGCMVFDFFCDAAMLRAQPCLKSEDAFWLRSSKHIRKICWLVALRLGSRAGEGADRLAIQQTS